MRKLATLALGFSGGIALAQFCLPHGWLLWMAAVALGVAFVSLTQTTLVRQRILLLCCGISLALGYQWFYVTTVVEPTQSLVGCYQAQLPLTLTQLPQATSYGGKAEVTATTPEGVSFEAIYYGDASLLEASLGWTVIDDVYIQSSMTIEGEDITTFSDDGIFLLLYGQGQTVMTPPSQYRWSPLLLCAQLKEQISRCFTQPYSGVVTALITGDKSDVNPEVSSDLSEAGIYHIMAVSGMHCGFLLAMVALLAGRQRRKLVACLAIPVLLCYMTLVGNTPSVVRACSMLIFLLIAAVVNRPGDAITAMSVALALILLENPYAIVSVSLQMSFGAVSGILLFSSGIYKGIVGEQKSKVLKFIALNLSVTVGAMAFTAPMSYGYFGIFWMVSPLSNLFCVWAVAWIFVSSLLTLAVSCVSLPLGLVIAHVPQLLMKYVFVVCDGLAHLPNHAVYQVNPYLKFWLAFAYVLFALVWFLGKTRRSCLLAMGSGAVTLLAVIALGEWRLTQNKVDGYAIDVGQGQCVLLESEGVTALVDCGSSNSWLSPGDTAADLLLTMGTQTLTYMVLTHYDSDHINGVIPLLYRMDIATLLVPEMTVESDLGKEVLAVAQDSGVDVVYITEETHLPLGESTLTLYPPVGSGNQNESGLSILCTLAEWDVLITGDMESATEIALLERYDLPHVEVWMVGHHGSSSSTSIQLLDSLTPTYAIISVGDNSYGHPTNQTLRRLVAKDALVYRTDLQGTIHFTAN